MKFIFKVLVASIVISSPASAWKETGGGDEVALDFQRAFANAVRTVKVGKLIATFTADDLLQTAREAKILVVEDALVVTLDGNVQSSIATNEPATGMIRINRDRWTRLRDDRLKEAVALHEVLSLRRIERTGNYSHSARYLEAFGISPWLISGTREDPSLDPKPKKMSCEVAYMPDPNDWNSRVVTNYEQVTSDNGDTLPHSLSARKTITTKDGRFDIYLWAVQPFRNAYLPFPHEYTTISIMDKKRNVQIGAGPNAVAEGAEANEDMRDSRASYITTNDTAGRDIEIMLNVKCGLK